MPSTLTQEVEVDFGQLTNATCIGVDALGQFAALGSRAGLQLLDLDSPFALARTLHYQFYSW